MKKLRKSNDYSQKVGSKKIYAPSRLLRFFRAFHFLVVASLLFTVSTQIFSEKPIRFSEGLQRLLEGNAKILESKAQILSFTALKTEASATDLPSLTLLTFVAPIFESHGNALQSTGDINGKWGPMIHGELQVVYPVFSFGRIGHAKKAADFGVEAANHLHQGQINKTIFEYKQLYLQLILLKRLKLVLDEASEKMKTVLALAEKLYKKGTGELQRKDLTRLKLFSLELEKFHSEWKHNHLSASRALGHFFSDEDSYLVLESDFPKIEEEQNTLQALIELGRKKNPDFKALSSGLQARRHQVEMEKGGVLPVLFIAARADGNVTPVRDRQESSYAFDPYNRSMLGIALGAKWDFDWGKLKANEQKAQSTLDALKAKQREADTGIPLKIAMAVWEYEKMQTQWNISRSKYKEANKWSFSEMSAYNTGTGNSKDLLEALGALLIAEKDLAESEYQVCVSSARLALEVGEQAMLKNWIEQNAE